MPRSSVPAPFPGETRKQYLNRLLVEHHLTPLEFSQLAPYAQANVAAVARRHYSAPSMSARRGAMYQGPSVRAAQMSLAQRQREVQRRQRMAGFKVTQFQQILQKNSGELKGMDTDLALGSVGAPILSTTGTNGDAVVINLVRTGNGSWNRAGRKIFLKSLRLQGYAQYHYANEATTGDLEGATLRMVVVWDKQPSGAAIPQFDEIFGVTDQAGTETTTVLSPRRYDNMSRFQVLSDDYIDCSPQANDTNAGGSTDSVKSVYHIDKFIKLGNRTSVFSGESTPMTIADISSGALYFYCRATRSTANTQGWVLPVMNGRIRYTD